VHERRVLWLGPYAAPYRRLVIPATARSPLAVFRATARVRDLEGG